VEADTFGFEAEALFDGGVAAKLDFSGGAQDTLPWKFEAAMEDLRYLAGHSWEAGCACDGSVGGNFAFWYAADRGLDALPGVRGLLVERWMRAGLPCLFFHRSFMQSATGRVPASLLHNSFLHDTFFTISALQRDPSDANQPERSGQHQQP
jgi:hypothetical protein